MLPPPDVPVSGSEPSAWRGPMRRPDGGWMPAFAPGSRAIGLPPFPNSVTREMTTPCADTWIPSPLFEWTLPPFTWLVSPLTAIPLPRALDMSGADTVAVPPDDTIAVAPLPLTVGLVSVPCEPDSRMPMPPGRCTTTEVSCADDPDACTAVPGVSCTV